MSGSPLTTQEWAFNLLNSWHAQYKANMKCTFVLGAVLLDTPACFVMLFHSFSCCAVLWLVLHCSKRLALYMYILKTEAVLAYAAL